MLNKTLFLNDETEKTPKERSSGENIRKPKGPLREEKKQSRCRKPPSGPFGLIETFQRTVKKKLARKGFQNLEDHFFRFFRPCETFCRKQVREMFPKFGFFELVLKLFSSLRGIFSGMLDKSW